MICCCLKNLWYVCRLNLMFSLSVIWLFMWFVRCSVLSVRRYWSNWLCRFGLKLSRLNWVNWFVRFIVSWLVCCILIVNLICRSSNVRLCWCSGLIVFMRNVICFSCLNCSWKLNRLIGVWLMVLVKCGLCVIMVFWRNSCVNLIRRLCMLSMIFGVCMGLCCLLRLCLILCCVCLCVILLVCSGVIRIWLLCCVSLRIWIRLGIGWRIWNVGLYCYVLMMNCIELFVCMLLYFVDFVY